MAQTTSALQKTRPIFEAGFRAAGVIAFADIMLPIPKGGKHVWKMVEVKSSASVKDYHRDDAAIQSYVVRRSKIPLSSIAVTHIDSNWVYAGNDDYSAGMIDARRERSASVALRLPSAVHQEIYQDNEIY